MNDTLEYAITAFMQYLQAEKHASEHTYINYQRDLLRLAAFCKERQISSWDALDGARLRTYIGDRHQQGISPQSLQKELSVFRSFYRFMQKRFDYQENPAKDLKAPKKARRLPKTLDVDQVCGMLDAAPDSVLEIRDLAMFEVFYSTGLRLFELAALDLGDIDLSAKEVRVRAGKGGKQRMAPLGGKAVQALKNWLQHRRSVATQAVFLSRQGKRLSQRSIQLRMDKWCQKQGVSEHVHPHMLRHSFAGHLLESSQDIRAVQELLGHSNISTTQIYTHLDFQHLADIYDKSHPRAKKK